MKRSFAVLIFLFLITCISLSQNGKKALLLIDIQDFYFPGGKSVLSEPEKAASNAALLLDQFRKNKMMIIHIRHNSEPGGQINSIVKPLPTEKTISKNEVNSFLGTDLREYLQLFQIDTLVICGMQTHMCVEAATRAASDMGYKCILIHDACATRDLKYGDKTIKAEEVHLSTLSTLKNYSTILSTDEYLQR
jgi:nicotinamidase-related amidase